MHRDSDNAKPACGSIKQGAYNTPLHVMALFLILVLSTLGTLVFYQRFLFLLTYLFPLKPVHSLFSPAGFRAYQFLGGSYSYRGILGRAS